jgi:hypothetical protein
VTQDWERLFTLKQDPEDQRVWRFILQVPSGRLFVLVPPDGVRGEGEYSIDFTRCTTAEMELGARSSSSSREGSFGGTVMRGGMGGGMGGMGAMGGMGSYMHARLPGGPGSLQGSHRVTRDSMSAVGNIGHTGSDTGGSTGGSTGSSTGGSIGGSRHQAEHGNSMVPKATEDGEWEDWPVATKPERRSRTGRIIRSTQSKSAQSERYAEEEARQRRWKREETAAAAAAAAQESAATRAIFAESGGDGERGSKRRRGKGRGRGATKGGGGSSGGGGGGGGFGELDGLTGELEELRGQVRGEGGVQKTMGSICCVAL